MSESKQGEAISEQATSEFKRAKAIADDIQSVIYRHNMSYADCLELLNLVGTLCDATTPNNAKNAIRAILSLYI